MIFAKIIFVAILTAMAEPVFESDFDNKTLSKNMTVQVSKKFIKQLKQKPMFVKDRFGKALNCGGISQYGRFVKLVSPPFSKGKPFTITCWFKPRGGWMLPLFYYKPHWHHPAGFMVLQNGSQIKLYVGKKCIVESDKANPIQRNTWYFLAILWNGKTWKMFLNGMELSGKDNPSFVFPGDMTPLCIGGYNVHTNNIFQGLMDKIKIFDTHLKQEDIIQIMENDIKNHSAKD